MGAVRCGFPVGFIGTNQTLYIMKEGQLGLPGSSNSTWATWIMGSSNSRIPYAHSSLSPLIYCFIPYLLLFLIKYVCPLAPTPYHISPCQDIYEMGLPPHHTQAVKVCLCGWGHQLFYLISLSLSPRSQVQNRVNPGLLCRLRNITATWRSWDGCCCPFP